MLSKASTVGLPLLKHRVRAYVFLPGEARISGPELQCDKSEALFFFYNCGNEKVNKTGAALVLSSSLLLLFLSFSVFEHWARSLEEPYNIKNLERFY